MSDEAPAETPPSPPAPSSSLAGGLLDKIERLGNALPDPATLFLIGTLLVMFLSQLAVSLDWSVQRTTSQQTETLLVNDLGDPILDPRSGDEIMVPVFDEETGFPAYERVSTPIQAKSLLSRDGIYWLLSSMVANFIGFAPLGVVLVAMLGIGLADRTGMLGAALKSLLSIVPQALLTPTTVFAGVMSSIALDAGYIVLPPIAAAMYKAAGRSPLAGLAAVFAGVSAGFSANLLPTGLDPLLAGLSESGARLLDAGYSVAPTCNYYFMVASTVLLTATGWYVTTRWVEPRLDALPPKLGGPPPREDVDLNATRLDAKERLGLIASLACMGVLIGCFVLLTTIPGAPLHGTGQVFDRWIEAFEPLLFLGFLIPGIVYGAITGDIRNDKDVAKHLSETMASMGPYVVLAFFAAQFIESFKYSGLGEMLAITGGHALSQAALPTALLMVVFILVVLIANLFMGSASAKYAFFSPVFVPMFMQVGVSPELTQAAYRVGDSVSNVITPLNPYMVILLVFLRQHVPKGGIGTLVSLMLPYTIVFLVVWSMFLVAWISLGIDLGPAGPLGYIPTR